MEGERGTEMCQCELYRVIVRRNRRVSISRVSQKAKTRTRNVSGDNRCCRRCSASNYSIFDVVRGRRAQTRRWRDVHFVFAFLCASQLHRSWPLRFVTDGNSLINCDLLRRVFANDKVSGGRRQKWKNKSTECDGISNGISGKFCFVDSGPWGRDEFNGNSSILRRGCRGYLRLWFRMFDDEFCEFLLIKIRNNQRKASEWLYINPEMVNHKRNATHLTNSAKNSPLQSNVE